MGELWRGSLPGRRGGTTAYADRLRFPYTEFPAWFYLSGPCWTEPVFMKRTTLRLSLLRVTILPVTGERTSIFRWPSQGLGYDR